MKETSSSTVTVCVAAAAMAYTTIASVFFVDVCLSAILFSVSAAPFNDATPFAAVVRMWRHVVDVFLPFLGWVKGRVPIPTLSKSRRGRKLSLSCSRCLWLSSGGLLTRWDVLLGFRFLPV